MNVVLLGAPGSGKGTQASPLCARYGMVHVSTGNIFREEIGKKSELGLRVEDYLKSGRLVPDELTIEVVKSRLQRPDCKAGFLMDGFPRTVGQAEALDGFLSEVKAGIDAVINIELADNVVVQRLSSRRQCRGCGKIYNILTQPPLVADKCDADGGELFQREDDKAATIEKRLMVFHDITKPLIAYYKGAGNLFSVDGARGVEQVTQEVFKILDARRR